MDYDVYYTVEICNERQNHVSWIYFWDLEEKPKEIAAGLTAITRRQEALIIAGIYWEIIKPE